MSQFLGPIHFWLYGKIGRQEALTRHLAEFALREGYLTDAAPYLRELPPLETVIDEGNIHGWLQSRISDAEARYAALVLTAVAGDAGREQALCEQAHAFGLLHAMPAGTSPAEAYKAFEDFFVNGMPCDRVNTVTESEDTRLRWEQTKELHGEHWVVHGGDSALYYRLRKAVMDGMLAGSGLRLDAADGAHYAIEKL